MSNINDIVFVANFCPHYRIKTFELLSREKNINFLFFSDGGEKYWLAEHGINTGNFQHTYVKSSKIFNTYFSFELVKKLLFENYDIYISFIVGKFSLPLTYLVSRLKGKKFILWSGVWTRIKTPSQKFLFPLTKYLYLHADAIVVYGSHVKKYLISEGVNPEKIFIAEHAVDNSIYSKEIPYSEKKKLLGELGINEDQKILLYLGRFDTVKGLPFLLEAFKKLDDDCVLVLAGTGSEKEKTKNLCHELGIDSRVRFTKYIEPEKTTAYYSISYVYILPSITVPEGKETWGLVVNEAFNQGLPVIATWSVGAAAGGLIEDNENGLIVNERSSQELFEAMKKIIDNPELREKMSKNAKLKIEKWNNELMIKGFLQAIEFVEK